MHQDVSAPFLRAARPAALAAAIALGLFPQASEAQRTTYSNINAWFTLTGEYAFTSRWSVIFDVSNRRSGPVDETQAVFLRAGMQFAVTDRVKFAIGGNRSESYPFGDLPIAYKAPEWRIWEHLLISHDAGRVAMSHRYRLEQRFQGKRSVASVDDIDTWQRSSRVRYKVTATLPLQGATLDDREFYLYGANEVFVSVGKSIQYNIFDQDRAQLSIGRRMSKTWRTEVGFMEHLSLKSNGRDVERNHTITFGLTYSRPAAAAAKK